jgi:hypothetical protein
MKLGASEKHPGISAHWKPECCCNHITLWYMGDVLGTVVFEDGAWKCVGLNGEIKLDSPPRHRWQAKRIVESIVSTQLPEYYECYTKE